MSLRLLPKRTHIAVAAAADGTDVTDVLKP
jgi:hypothetical protein